MRNERGGGGMKILCRAKMHDGNQIQIEDWSNDYSFYGENDLVVIYYTNKKHDSCKVVRTECRFENGSKAMEAFKALISGKKNIDDFCFTAKAGGKGVPIRAYIRNSSISWY